MADHYLGERRQRRVGLILLIVVVIALLLGSRYIASTLLDYAWWSEMGQLDTWYGLLLYGTAPVLLATLLLWICFYLSFQIGSRHEDEKPLLGFLKRSFVLKAAALASFFLALIAANATVDNWTVVRFFGGGQLPSRAGDYVAPVFGRSLHFYFFGLPFYNMLLHLVLVATIGSLLIYWLASNLQTLSSVYPALAPAVCSLSTKPRGFATSLMQHLSGWRRLPPCSVWRPN